jgi:hypothetical protein
MYYPGWLGVISVATTLDLRRYFGIGTRHVIALQALTVATSGETPFSRSRNWEAANVRGYYGDATAPLLRGVPVRMPGEGLVAHRTRRIRFGR